MFEPAEAQFRLGGLASVKARRSQSASPAPEAAPTSVAEESRPLDVPEPVETPAPALGQRPRMLLGSSTTDVQRLTESLAVLEDLDSA